VNRSIKHLSILAISSFLLVACQQEENKTETKTAEKAEQKVEKKPANEEVNQSTTVKPLQSSEHDGHNHGTANAVVTGEKYAIVESQEACEKPIVIEFFAYHCPHCNDLEPAAEAWRKKNADKITFRSVPTDLGHRQYGSLLLAHHAAKRLGTLEKTQHALFNRVHNEKKLFGSAEELAQFLADQGADLEKAKVAVADQAALTESIRADFDLLNKYKISSVPQVLVNHKYMTDITIAGGHKEVFDIVDETLKLNNSCGK